MRRGEVIDLVALARQRRPLLLRLARHLETECGGIGAGPCRRRAALYARWIAQAERGGDARPVRG
jgi:hypothetical protein